MVKVTILASGIALGVYVPALLLRDNLVRHGIDAEVVLFESLYTNGKLEKVQQNKWHFHNNVRLAIKGHQLPSKVSDAVDAEEKKRLFTKWKREKRYRFVIFSGFWVPLVREYLENYRFPLDAVDCIHMDAVVSSSWAAHMEDSAPFQAIWPFSFRDNCVNTTIPIGESPLSTYDNRPLQVMIHGGGWGMGTYPVVLPELVDARIHTCCTVYSSSDSVPESPFMHRFWMDENWTPFGQQLCDYPPLRDESGMLAFLPHTHKVFNLLTTCRAVISKPGGATLLDSLESGTPIIFLSPVGAYEEYNARLWKSLGFGLDYEEWKEQGFSFEPLIKAHERLRRCRENIKGVEEQLCSLKQM